MTENIAMAKPQKTFLRLPCKAKRETKTTAENTESTKVNRAKILIFSFLGANMMNIKTYMISIPAPVPFTVVTGMLLGDTKGRPYLWMLEIRSYSNTHLCAPRAHTQISSLTSEGNLSKYSN